MKKNELEIPIMFCFDNNYVIPAGVAFYSLLENANKNYKYKFFVLHSDITEENQSKLIETVKPFESLVDITFVNMENRFQDIWEKIRITGHFSKEVMYKVLVASLFPQYDKIITTDVDVVFLNDISESYTSFDCEEDVYLAGTKMVGKMNWYMSNYKPDFSDEEIEKLSSFCGGYIVFNLKKIREDNMEECFIECFKNDGHRINQMEQDVLNLCCYPKIKLLPLKYVACSYLWDLFKTEQDLLEDPTYSKEELMDALNNTVQLHYATSIKPWKCLSCTKSEEWFKYLVKTPFLKEFLNKVQEEKEENKAENIAENSVGETENKLSIRKIIRIMIRIIKKIIKLARRILGKVKRTFFKQKPDTNPSILILDDIFPSKLSSFRYQEYLSYLNNFDNVFITSSGKAIKYLKEDETIENIIEQFKKEHPEHQNKIIKYDENVYEESLNNYAKYCSNKIALFTFINNVCMDDYKVLKFLEKNEIPFIFTLYPGGGFSLNNKECDEKLARVFSSPCFKKVIVTQQLTYDYLIDNNFCVKEDIEFVYGIVSDANIKKIDVKPKKLSERINVCFVAYKYSNKGFDKGYDLFINSAKTLLKKHPNMFFHVVGNFSEEDIDVSELNGHISFYGVRNKEWFSKFFKDKHIIISPNRPFALSEGAFDGFPTGACTEAMFNGLIAVCTDELNQNIFYENNKDIVLVKPFVNDIVHKVDDICSNPRKFFRMSKRSLKKTYKRYSYKEQMIPRIKLIKNVAKEIYYEK